MFDTKFLLANLVWGSIAAGYILYGRKQREMVPFIGGVLMVVVSFLVTSALLMSLLSIALMVLIYVLMKRGW
jgi:hypothetical protein